MGTAASENGDASAVSHVLAHSHSTWEPPACLRRPPTPPSGAAAMKVARRGSFAKMRHHSHSKCDASSVQPPPAAAAQCPVAICLVGLVCGGRQRRPAAAQCGRWQAHAVLVNAGQAEPDTAATTRGVRPMRARPPGALPSASRARGVVVSCSSVGFGASCV